MSDEWALEFLTTYLRFPTVHPDPDYGPCVEFLVNKGIEAGLSVKVVNVAERKPVVLMTKEGTNANLPAILLNSHMDVVPVTEEKWGHDPFGAHCDDKGNIFARGSQDMKSVGVAQLASLFRLIQRNHSFNRTVHLTFVPGGVHGMKTFVETMEFQQLNVGLVLDEGIPSPNAELLVFNDERALNCVKIMACGAAGHGSAMLQGTAVDRLLKALVKVSNFRDAQMKLLYSSDDIIRDCGCFTSVNINGLRAGVQYNVIPDQAEAQLDIRLARDHGEDGLVKLLEDWTKGDGLSCTIERKTMLIDASPWGPTVPFYNNLKEVLNGRKINMHQAVFPGATDSRHIRIKGIHAYGFTPFRNTLILLHDHDEYLNSQIFLEGVAIYTDLLAKLTSEGMN